MICSAEELGVKRFYLEKGLEIERVSRILKIEQSAWLRPYIDLNTELRQSAGNKFEESIAKLMNNSFFGKTCEDFRKYKNMKIALTEQRARKLIARPTCK